MFTLFEDYFVNTGANGPAEFRPTRCLQIWFGDTYRDGFSQEHLAMRDKLSNAAYAGDFDGIFEVLRYVEETFGECWVDAPRLSTLSQIDILTPLCLILNFRLESRTDFRLVTSSPGRIHERTNLGGTRFARYWWF